MQCRRVDKPLTEAGILKECRAALGLKAELKEIIFATTAPDDTKATDGGISVEKTVRGEGHDLSVAVYGWGNLQTLICLHEAAYAAFHPSMFATHAQQPPTGTSFDTSVIAQIAQGVAAELRDTGLLRTDPATTTSSNAADEDRDLHARIDVYRDLFKVQKQSAVAEKGLLELRALARLEEKPWARYRIETNLGSIALELGKEAEGAAH